MQHQKQLQRAFRDHVVAQNPRAISTFNYVRQISFDQMRAHIIDFNDRMQRRILALVG